ncbi:substrate-binding domain-containing protein [Bacillaceae bacterium IKA-2]|nr:substrate-binding domain-containing protein [Bacillaceae bacterium IKA-2]
MKPNKTIKLYWLLLIMLVISACSDNNETTHKFAESNETDKKSELILATTTSTQDSGLLDVLIPIFEEKHNIHVKAIAVGTGQALAMGERGEVDALLTHAPVAEEKLVAEKAVINRKRVMYNDFIIVGPTEDLAAIKGETAEVAFQKIHSTGASFVSRGDDSGTHKIEQSLWDRVKLNPTDKSWYFETGQGMGSTLQISAERDGYILTDRATYLAHQKNFQHQVILVEGDVALLNVYHVMQVNEAKHSFVNGETSRMFVEFMVSDETQAIIEEFGKDVYGQALFLPYLE